MRISDLSPQTAIGELIDNTLVTRIVPAPCQRLNLLSITRLSHRDSLVTEKRRGTSGRCLWGLFFQYR